jgi:putative membrane protein
MRTAMEQTSGWNGFLPGRASFMLDAIVVTMFFVLVALGVSVCLVKYRRRYTTHKAIQLGLASCLVVVLVLFEIDIHFIDNWVDRAVGSPYFDAASRSGLVANALAIHLVFAISTFALWLLVIVRALRNFPSPPEPGEHSRFHRRWGIIAALDMVLTTLTGWVFYWLAFVA